MTAASREDLVSSALRFAIEGHMRLAVDCVRRLAVEHGPDSVPEALLAWIDTTWHLAFPDGLPDGYLDSPMLFVTTNTDRGVPEPLTVDEVEPAVRWAGRFIYARLADDEAQGRALVASVESDEQWSDAVLTVLDACACMVRTVRAERAAEGA